MDNESREKVALFRFGVISSLIARKGMSGRAGRTDPGHCGQELGDPRLPAQLRFPLDGARWLTLYERAGGKVEVGQPRVRCDWGTTRALDPETEAALVALKREIPAASLPVLLKMARQRQILSSRIRSPFPASTGCSNVTVWTRITAPVDRRRFETELSNDMWQSDCLHGPRVIVEGKLRKSYLFAIIDDHSRLIPHAQFYLARTSTATATACLSPGETRPASQVVHGQRLAFRSHQLKYACARLGIALLHTAPYTPKAGARSRGSSAPCANLPAPAGGILSLAQLNAAGTGSRANTTSAFTAPPARPRWSATSPMCRCCGRAQGSARLLPARRMEKGRQGPRGEPARQALRGPRRPDPQDRHAAVPRQGPPENRGLFQEPSFGFLLPLNAGVNSRVRESPASRPC